MSPIAASDEMKWQALLARYDIHATSLRALTGFDLKIFAGYLTLQAGLGAWLAVNGRQLSGIEWPALLLDLAFVLLAGTLLHKNFRRRIQYTEGLWDTLEALRFFESDAYLPGRALDAKPQPSWWFPSYLAGIIVGAAVGPVVVMLG